MRKMESIVKGFRIPGKWQESCEKWLESILVTYDGSIDRAIWLYGLHALVVKREHIAREILYKYAKLSEIPGAGKPTKNQILASYTKGVPKATTEPVEEDHIEDLVEAEKNG